MVGYDEARIVFDRYIQNSLKELIRKKRLGQTISIKVLVKDNSSIKLVSMKTFLSHNETRSQLTAYLGKALLTPI